MAFYIRANFSSIQTRIYIYIYILYIYTYKTTNVYSREADSTEASIGSRLLRSDFSNDSSR